MEQRSVICIPRGVLLFLAQQESQMAICYLWAGGCWVTASPGEPSLPGRGRNLPENLSCVFTSACSSIVSFMVTLQPWSFQHGNTVQVLFTSLNISLILVLLWGKRKDGDDTDVGSKVSFCWVWAGSGRAGSSPISCSKVRLCCRFGSAGETSLKVGCFL